MDNRLRIGDGRRARFADRGGIEQVGNAARAAFVLDEPRGPAAGASVVQRSRQGAAMCNEQERKR